MTTKEKLEIERNNDNFIKLYKEGIFWRAYNVSCMLFTQYFKNYKIIKKYIKYLNDTIYYCGFPETILATILDTFTKQAISYRYINEKEIIIENLTIQKLNYDEWQNNISIDNDTKKIFNDTKKINFDIKDDIISQIINYPIAESTPIEAFNFLYKIQKQLKNGSITFYIGKD